MKRLNNDILACGQKGLPRTIDIDGQQWHHRKTFKHDFFACTGLYCQQDRSEQFVLKMGRCQSFFGIPMEWLGRMLRNHECRIISQLTGIDQLPELIKKHAKTGLIYRYIQGKSLDEWPELPENFFGNLEQLLTSIHQRNVCYVDMNKRGNILLGCDQRPYIIDFQISLHLPRHWSGFLKQAFQREDHYHLLKHKRRFCPDQLTPDEQLQINNKSLLIRTHRIIGGTLRNIRRVLLRWLYRKGILQPNIDIDCSPENDYRRFLK